MLKTCLAGQCCVARFKQPIGEIIMVLLVGFIYLATVVFVHLPKLEKFIKMETVSSLASLNDHDEFVTFSPLLCTDSP